MSGLPSNQPVDGQPVGDAPAVVGEFEFLDECDRHLPDIAGGSFSGKIIEKDQGRVDAVIGAFVGGISQRRIAPAFGMSRNTVAGIIARATEAGKIEPLKRRLSSKLGRAVEAAIEQWVDAVEDGKVNASQIPIAVGIFLDKKGMIDGEPSAVVEHRRAEPTAEDMRKWIHTLPSAVDS